MQITALLFDAFLKCKMKAHLLSSAYTEACYPLHQHSNFVRLLSETFERQCSNYLIDKYPAQYFIGTLPMEDIVSGKHLIIIGPTVTFDDLASCIHALEKESNRAGVGINKYKPIRFVASEIPDRTDKLLLVFDAIVFARSCGSMPRSGKIIYGRQRRTITVQLAKLLPKTSAKIDELRATLATDVAPTLSLIKHCTECQFELHCKNKAIEKDDLSLLGGIKPKELAKLRNRGISTVNQLSYGFHPRRKRRRSPEINLKYHHSLKALSIREKRIYISGSRALDTSGNALYFDVEGVPDRKFYYLIGVRFPGGGGSAQRSLWADNDAGEERIWKEFLQIVTEVEHPRLFHYGSYETMFLRHMRKRYGDNTTNGHSIDNLIKGAQNVLSHLYGHIYFPTYSNGLKEIASAVGFRWSTESPSGQRSVLLRHHWELTGSESAKQELVAYNADDCKALELVTSTALRIALGDDASSNLPVANVESLKSALPYSLGRVDFALPELEQINRRAYWDYQRSRVYVRSNKRLKRCNRELT